MDANVAGRPTTKWECWPKAPKSAGRSGDGNIENRGSARERVPPIVQAADEIESAAEAT